MRAKVFVLVGIICGILLGTTLALPQSRFVSEVPDQLTVRRTAPPECARLLPTTAALPIVRDPQESEKWSAALQAYAQCCGGITPDARGVYQPSPNWRCPKPWYTECPECARHGGGSGVAGPFPTQEFCEGFRASQLEAFPYQPCYQWGEGKTPIKVEKAQEEEALAVQQELDEFDRMNAAWVRKQQEQIRQQQARMGHEIQAYSNSPRQYKRSGMGLVGGTTWIYGYNVPPGPEGEELRARMLEMLDLNRKLAGVKKEDFIDPKEYNFIVGVGAAYEAFDDLRRRVIRDQWEGGHFSAENQGLYASLRNREFDRLDCHSNGAMVCLAALELGDVKTKHLRLFGPQITAESLLHWQHMVEEGKVSKVELYINKGDPVPGFSFVAGGGTIRSLYSSDALRNQIGAKAPGIYVKVLDCPGRQKVIDIKVCHSLNTYLKSLETQ